MAKMRKRFEAMKKISTNFKMIMPKHLSTATVEEYSLLVENFNGLYKDDFDSADLNGELGALRNWFSTIVDEDPDSRSIAVVKCHNKSVSVAWQLCPLNMILQSQLTTVT